MLNRLIHDFFGIRFEIPMADLEMGFWNAAARTRPMPGAREALEQFHQSGMSIAVVSNTCFSERVIRHELEKHGLASHLAFVVTSADYAVRKPDVLLFEIAAERLGIAPKDIWFVGDRLDTDVTGARAAGMTAVWLQPHKQRATSGDADVVVGDWKTLAKQVQQAGEE